MRRFACYLNLKPTGFAGCEQIHRNTIGQGCAQLRFVMPGGIDGNGLGLGEERFAALFVLVDQEGDTGVSGGSSATMPE